MRGALKGCVDRIVGDQAPAHHRLGAALRRFVVPPKTPAASSPKGGAALGRPCGGYT